MNFDTVAYDYYYFFWFFENLNLIMDINACLEILKEGKPLNERDLRIVCEKVKELLIEESNVQPVWSPVIVCGDIHGQFYDLLELFRVGEEIPNSSYIFIGNIFYKHFFRWFLRQRVQFGGNIRIPILPESQISRTHNATKRKPRKQTNYTSVNFYPH